MTISIGGAEKSRAVQWLKSPEASPGRSAGRDQDATQAKDHEPLRGHANQHVTKSGVNGHCWSSRAVEQRAYGRKPMTKSAVICLALIIFDASNLAVAADPSATLPLKAAGVSSAYDWSGFYVGGYLGYGWGRSNWSEAPDIISDSFSLSKPIDAFQNTGSFFCRTSSRLRLHASEPPGGWCHN
jgi:hypothetical protein